MFKSRHFYYIVDKLNARRAESIRKSLRALPGVEGVIITLNRGMIEVLARKDVAVQVQIACEAAGAQFRTRADL